MGRLVIGVVAALLIMTAALAGASAPTVAGVAGPASDQDLIAAARDLYASAAYEDALAALNGLPGSNRSAEETRAIEQYRALCLLALGRTTEAERTIEAVVAGDPMYRPPVELSPRLRTAFSDVRRRVLPAIIQQQYRRAKEEYDRKEFAAAAADFAKVLDVMNDPDAAAVSQTLSDLRVLAVGFKDLAATAAAPPVPPPPAPVQPSPQSREPKVYTSEDANVVAPIVLRQELPPYPGSVPLMRKGLIEVVIDETGLVESVTIRKSVQPNYDSLALAAARNWWYWPATLNGEPVKYRKVVQVTIKPERSP